jgi:hypothetical protein
MRGGERIHSLRRGRIESLQFQLIGSDISTFYPLDTFLAANNKDIEEQREPGLDEPIDRSLRE